MYSASETTADQPKGEAIQTVVYRAQPTKDTTSHLLRHNQCVSSEGTTVAAPADRTLYTLQSIFPFFYRLDSLLNIQYSIFSYSYKTTAFVVY